MPEDSTAEIATTCAIDHETWENVLPPGISEEDGLRVHRFLVGPRDQRRYDELHAKVASEGASYATELEWLSNSVWSRDLQVFLEDKGPSYDLVVFSPYLFGTTLWGAQVDPERSVLLPCLHDEGYARLVTVGRVFEAVRGCIFNSEAEQRFARRLYGAADGHVVGIGFDRPSDAPTVGFAEPRGLGRYLLYAGRIEEAKHVDVAVEYASRYAAERVEAPQLVLIGSGSYCIPNWAVETVQRIGFLSDEERRAAYAEALALVNPSHLESLSIVLLEAWLEGTPALVASGSDVLREHLERSNGGFSFRSYPEFRDAVDQLLQDAELGKRLGAAGRSYVVGRYGWPSVRERLSHALERLAE